MPRRWRFQHGTVVRPARFAACTRLADGLLNGITRPEDLHDLNRLLDGIKDRTTREKIAQALTAAQPASLLAATQIVEAQTPPALADDEAEPLAADTERTESLWPAESSLDEPSLEQEYHDSHARHFERGAERRFRQLLKVRIQPRWKFTGVPPAEREHLRDEIDNLIGWLKAARADLELD